MTTLPEWVVELAGALDVDPADVDTTLLLDVARDAAHGVTRPAAPLTTFLVGYAAGLRGGGAAAVAQAASTAQSLAVARGSAAGSDAVDTESTGRTEPTQPTEPG